MLENVTTTLSKLTVFVVRLSFSPIQVSSLFRQHHWRHYVRYHYSEYYSWRVVVRVLAFWDTQVKTFLYENSVGGIYAIAFLSC